MSLGFVSSSNVILNSDIDLCLTLHKFGTWRLNSKTLDFFQGDLVYVNYGRLEDYTVLEAHQYNVSGKIVFARYGEIYRGDQVYFKTTFS